jgi:hypothetical protein
MRAKVELSRLRHSIIYRLLVRTIAAAKPVQGRCSFAWDGRDETGRVVADEAYAFRIEFVDAKGRELCFPADQPSTPVAIPPPGPQCSGCERAVSAGWRRESNSPPHVQPRHVSLAAFSPPSANVGLDLSLPRHRLRSGVRRRPAPCDRDFALAWNILSICPSILGVLPCLQPHRS